MFGENEDEFEIIFEEEVDEQEISKPKIREEVKSKVVEELKSEPKPKAKNKMHLYRFKCVDSELKKEGIFAETCEDCTVGLLYITSNSQDYFRDICMSILGDPYSCLTSITQSFDDEPLESPLTQISKDQKFIQRIEDCIENLGEISQKEIEILAKFDILTYVSADDA